MVLAFIESNLIFSIIAAILLIIVGILVEFEVKKVPNVIFIGGFLTSIWLFRTQLIDFCSDNFLLMILGFISYIVLGIIWSLIKWSFFISSKYRKIIELSEKYDLNDKKELVKFVRKLNESKIGSYVYDDSSLDIVLEQSTPKLNDYKSLIISWIAYFPISILTTLFNDPMKRFFNWLFRITRGLYNSIVTRYKNKLIKKVNK